MKLFTSRYGNKELAARTDLVKVGASLGYPKWKLPYQVAGVVREIAPSGEILHIEDEAIYRLLYLTKLDRTGAATIRKRLAMVAGAKADIVLLCFEDLRNPDKWCHRRMFAEWWKGQTGEDVDELPEGVVQETMF